jgi:hypothetical protein
MELAIGSNTFRNTNGVLTLQGKEQLVLEFRPESNLLLLTMDLYDKDGDHIAHLRRNRWAFNIEDRFTLFSQPPSPSLFLDPPSLRLLDQNSDEVVFEAAVVEKEKIVISQGTFFTHQGQLVEITSHLCRLSGITTMFGEVRDVRGGPVVLG